MSESSRGAMVTRSVLIARLVGLCIYVWAFFLPAVREVATAGNDAPEMLRGSRCAWVTLVNTLNPEMWHSKDFLAVLSGWINPLMVLYLIFLLFPIFRWPRRIVAGIIVLFIFATWVLFVLYPLVPLVGHFLWIVGILLILAGEVFGREKADSRAA
ncbi:MAG: hypothetical protein ABSC76_16755 [Terracidiphilus sp.]